MSVKEDGFSGLEAAIVLIAFVVVAAVFSFATLSSGFFASEKAEDITHTGYKQASSGVYIDGSLYGALSSDGHLDTLTFYIANPETGLDQDLAKMVMAYTKSDTPTPMSLTLGATPDSHHFSIGSGGTTSAILMPGTKTRVNFADLNGPTATGWFSIEVKPYSGASYLLHRFLSEGYEGGIIR